MDVDVGYEGGCGVGYEEDGDDAAEGNWIVSFVVRGIDIWTC